jgi:hypothetical protein
MAEARTLIEAWRADWTNTKNEDRKSEDLSRSV